MSGDVHVRVHACLRACSFVHEQLNNMRIPVSVYVCVHVCVYTHAPVGAWICFVSYKHIFYSYLLWLFIYIFHPILGYV